MLTLGGQLLGSGYINRSFDPDHIHATSEIFKKNFGDDGGRYKFGHWILLHDPWFGQLNYPADRQWKRVVDNDLEPGIRAAITAAVKACLLAEPDPIPIIFSAPGINPGSHRLEIKTVEADPHNPRSYRHCSIALYCPS